MPPVVAAVAAFASWAGISVAAAWAITAVTVVSAGMAVYGTAQARRAERTARDQQQAAMKDRMATRIATEAPHRYIYGRAKVGADIVAMLTSGDRDQFKHLVCVHAAHECDAIEEVYVNNAMVSGLDTSGDPTTGRYATTPDTGIAEEAHTGPTFTLARTPRAGSVWAFSGTDANMAPVAVTAQSGRSVTVNFTGPVLVTYEYRIVHKFSNDPIVEAPPEKAPVVRVRKHLGNADDVADAYLRQVLGDKWPETAVLRGLCYTVITLDLTHPEFQGGIPPIHAVIRGRRVYDPRDGATRWTQNPALIIRDYLTSPLCGVPAADLPASQFIAAANVCDEVSPTGGTRYTINGTVTSDQAQSSVLESMAQAMAGGLIATTWDVYAGKYIAPVVALTQEDIVGGLSITPGVSDASTYNGIKGQYIGPENKYVQTDFKPYQNDAYRAADGRDLYNNLDFPFTDSLQRVTNLARIFTEDQRNGFTIKAEFSLKAWPLKVGQRVTFTSAFLGQSAKVYRITDKAYSPTSAVSLTLKEDSASIWDYADTTLLDDTPNTELPDPWHIDPLASISCTSGEATLLRQADGSTIPRIMVSWPATAQANGKQIEIEWRAVSSATWERTTVSAGDTQAYLSPITPGFFYVVRARVANPALNAYSVAVSSVYQVEIQKATPTIYRWAADKPAAPAGAASYQWSNGTFGAAPAGWSLTKPAVPAAGSVTLWAASVLVSDVDADGSAPFDWASAAVVAIASTRSDWASIIGAGKPADNASADLTLVAENVTVSGNNITKSNAIGWTSQAYSNESYVGGAYASAVATDATSFIIFGLNSDPASSASAESIDYAIYLHGSNGYRVGQSGAFLGVVGPYAAGDVFAVVYDGSSVKYLRNGVVFYTSALAASKVAGQVLYFDSALYTAGARLSNIRFAPLSSNADGVAALAAVNNISSDNVLSKGEKSQVILEWANIGSEYTAITTQAAALSVSTTDYAAKRQALADYLATIPTWNDTAQDTAIVGTTFRTKFADYYAARAAIENSIAAKAATMATANGIAGMNHFRVLTQGFDRSVTMPAGTYGLYKNGMHVYPAANTYTLILIRRSDGVVIFNKHYDLYNSPSAADSLKWDLTNAGPENIVVVYTFDEPQKNRFLYGLADAMYRCGASRAVFGSSEFKFRSAYCLVGIPGCGEGNGAEFYQGAIDADPNAWIDVALTITNGNYTVSGSYTPRTLRDYGYTGDPAATAGAPNGSYVGGVLAETVASKATNAVSGTPGFALNAYFDPEIYGAANSTLSATFSVNPTGYTGSYSVRWMLSRLSGGPTSQGPFLTSASGNTVSVTGTAGAGRIAFEVTVIVTHSGGLTASASGMCAFNFGGA